MILAVALTVATLLAMNAGPAMANDWDDGCIGVRSGGECIGVGDDRDHDLDRWNAWHNDRNHWNGWNDWDNDFDFDDCFWWDGDLYCEVDW